MSDAPGFSKLVPGFDFLNSLVQNAGAALPNIGQWVAPTLNPEEIEKRIGELRTVQFWLEQNVRMLGATIQALEVQRMTLTTLRTMNVQMNDLGEALKIRLPDPEPEAEPEPEPEYEPEPEPDPPAPEPSAPRAEGASASTAAAPAGVPDPVQWWGALTQQFTQLAASAMQDAAKGDFANAVKATTHAAGQMAQAAAAQVARKPGSEGEPAEPAAKASRPTRARAPAKKSAAKAAPAKRAPR